MEARARITSNGHVEPRNRWAKPLLDARLGGPAEGFARRLRGHHPAAVFLAAILAGLAVLIVIGIGLGMHHPLDVAGGSMIGIGALLVLLFACRAAGVAHEARSPQRATVAIRHPRTAMRRSSKWLRT